MSLHALVEYVEHTEQIGSDIYAASIEIVRPFNYGQSSDYVVLSVKHTLDEYMAFISKLEFFYSAPALLCGTLWFRNGSWSERETRGDRAVWVNYKRPKPPSKTKV